MYERIMSAQLSERPDKNYGAIAFHKVKCSTLVIMKILQSAKKDLFQSNCKLEVQFILNEFSIINYSSTVLSKPD